MLKKQQVRVNFGKTVLRKTFSFWHPLQELDEVKVSRPDLKTRLSRNGGLSLTIIHYRLQSSILVGKCNQMFGEL